ncbi:hypothetical protein BHM03_00045674 [Ensete ventricosum]|nr:hypothetical protein BHM03_00045674 [Ensete ventricosum]
MAVREQHATVPRRRRPRARKDCTNDGRTSDSRSHDQVHTEVKNSNLFSGEGEGEAAVVVGAVLQQGKAFLQRQYITD